MDTAVLPQDTLAGLPNCAITARWELPGGGERLACTYESPTPLCPRCRQPARTKGWAELRELHDLPRGGQPQILQVRARRWRWACECTDEQQAARRSPRRRQPSSFTGLAAPVRTPDGRERAYTDRLKNHLLDQWARGASRRDLAHRCGLTEEQIKALVDDYRPDLQRVSRYRVQERRPVFIGLDEVFWRGQPLTVIMDIGPQHFFPPKGATRQEREYHRSRGRVIDVLPSRDPLTLERFFRQMTTLMQEAGVPDWRPVIASDMWGDFRFVIRRVFGGRAIHVADRFHVAAKIAQEVISIGEQLHLREVMAANQRYPDRAQRLAAAEQRGELLAAYRRALTRQRRGQAQPSPVTPASFAPGTLELITLAAELDFLWSDQDTQRESIARFRAWQREVGAWKRRWGGGLEPFNELIYLLDREAWIVEVTNANRPEARPAREHLPDPAGVRAPEARPPEDRRASTARVEALNRTIRRLEERSPNQRRNAFASKRWHQWNEQGLFERYRERLLYALNAPPVRRATLSRTLACEDERPARCPACRVSWPATRMDPAPTRTARQAWDVPLAGARVEARWQAVHWTCPACRAVTSSPPEGDPDAVTPELLSYLRAAVQGDHTLTGLHVETGAPVPLIRQLEAELGPVPDPALPEGVGVLLFRWRNFHRLLMTDVTSGRPVALLHFGDRHATPEDLHTWLTHPDRAGIRRVWVEGRRWLPTSAHRVTFHLDAFGRGRLIQRAVQALQKDFTNRMTPSIRRTPGWRGHRARLLSTTDKARWPLLDRVHAREREELRSRMLSQSRGLAFGLRMIDDLRSALTRDADETTWTTWLEYVQVCVQEELSQATPEDARSITQAANALRRITFMSEDEPLKQAVLQGARADGPWPARNPDDTDALTPVPAGVSLARSRRRLQDLRATQAFRARDAEAWTRLCRVAFTGTGRFQ